MNNWNKFAATCCINGMLISILAHRYLVVGTICWTFETRKFLLFWLSEYSRVLSGLQLRGMRGFSGSPLFIFWVLWIEFFLFRSLVALFVLFWLIVMMDLRSFVEDSLSSELCCNIIIMWSMLNMLKVWFWLFLISLLWFRYFFDWFLLMLLLWWRVLWARCSLTGLDSLPFIYFRIVLLFKLMLWFPRIFISTVQANLPINYEPMSPLLHTFIL